MTKIFPNLVKEKDTQVQEAHRVPNKMNPKRPTTGHIIIEVANIKDKENLKSSMRKTVTYKGAPITYELISQQEHFRPEGTGTEYST